jgi:hypothetical protein
MIPGMGVAFSNVRERILSVDVTHRIQLDREELRLYAELRRSRVSVLTLKEEVAKMKAELEQEKGKAARLADHSRSIISKNETLHVTKDGMEQSEDKGSGRERSLCAKRHCDLQKAGLLSQAQKEGQYSPPLRVFLLLPKS